MDATSQRFPGSANHLSTNANNCRFQSSSKISSNILHRGYRSPISPQPKSPLAKSVSPRERSASSGKAKSRKSKSKFQKEHTENQRNALSPMDAVRNGTNAAGESFFKYFQLNELAENYSNDHLECVDLLRRNWERAVDHCSHGGPPNLPSLSDRSSLVHVYDDDNCGESVVSVASSTTASSSTSMNNSDVATCSSLSSFASIPYYEENKNDYDTSLECSSTSTDLEHCNTPSLEGSHNGFNHVAVNGHGHDAPAPKPKFSIDEWLEQRILEQVFLTQ